MNFDSPKLTKIKQKSKNTTRCNNIFTIPLFSAMVGLNLIFYYFILEKCYLYNIFTINFQWQIVIGFKLGPLLILLFYLSKIPCHLEFVVKLLWKYCELNIFLIFYFDLWDLSNCKNIVTTTRYYNIFTIHLFSVEVDFNLIFYYFILSYKKLINNCENIVRIFWVAILCQHIWLFKRKKNKA